MYQISKGIDNEPVESRIIPKSIGSCKSFPTGLKVKDEIKMWLNTLMNDIVDKLKYDYEAVYIIYLFRLILFLKCIYLFIFF